MSYYINHALKLTFKEYNKFVKHCREYIDDDIMYKFNISDLILVHAVNKKCKTRNLSSCVVCMINAL